MDQKRKSFGENINIVLFDQVNGVCPICDDKLMHQKKGAKHKSYEIAHIFPLNPKSDEIEILKNEEKLNDDLNHEDNLIPLCKRCHGRFDKPRTVDEYRKLVDIKKTLITKSSERDLWYEYKIEEDISKIIDSLYSETPLVENCELTLEPKEVDRKVDDTMTNLTKQKIKNYVGGYFGFIKSKFATIDAENPGVADIISTQVKLYYLKQRQIGHSQQEIYSNIVDWILRKTKPASIDAGDALASFFIQNCEVLE